MGAIHIKIEFNKMFIFNTYNRNLDVQVRFEYKCVLKFESCDG